MLHPEFVYSSGERPLFLFSFNVFFLLFSFHSMRGCMRFLAGVMAMEAARLLSVYSTNNLPKDRKTGERSSGSWKYVLSLLHNIAVQYSR